MNKKLIALLIVSIILILISSILGYLYFVKSQEFRIQPIELGNPGNNGEMRIMQNNDNPGFINETPVNSNTISSPDSELDNLEKELEIENLEDL